MKKHLLMKTLLVALVCLVGGTSSVWGEVISFSATNRITNNGDGTFTTAGNAGNQYALAIADLSGITGENKFITIEFDTNIPSGSRWLVGIGDKDTRGTNACGSSSASYNTTDGLVCRFGTSDGTYYRVNGGTSYSLFDVSVHATFTLNKRLGTYSLVLHNNSTDTDVYTASGTSTTVANATIVELYSWVNSATVTVSDVTVTVKDTYEYSVNAVDGEDYIIKANIASGSCYANEEKSFYIPACVLVDGVLYFTADASYSKTETVSSNNQVFPYAYTTSTVNNVKYFFEGENLNVYGTSGSSSTGTKSSESNGNSRRPLANSYLYTPALAGGNYTVYIRVFGNNAKSENLAIYYCDADGENPVSLDVNTESSTASSYTTVSNANIAIPDGKCLAFYKGTDNSNFVIDYIYLIATSVPVEVTAAGFATYVPSYDLNFSATSIEAYKVKVSSKGVATLTKVNNVPAGTPVLLYKDGGATENIPVMTGAAAVTDNDLIAGTGAAVATTDGEYTNMILNNVSGIGFYFANGKTVATNRAYLHFATSLAPDHATARMTMIFEDEDVTGVNEVRSQKEDVRSEWFDLQGRKVVQPQKGLYIVNGKKVVLK